MIPNMTTLDFVIDGPETLIRILHLEAASQACACLTIPIFLRPFSPAVFGKNQSISRGGSIFFYLSSIIPFHTSTKQCAGQGPFSAQQLTFTSFEEPYCHIQLTAVSTKPGTLS